MDEKVLPGVPVSCSLSYPAHPLPYWVRMVGRLSIPSEIPLTAHEKSVCFRSREESAFSPEKSGSVANDS